MPNSLIKLQRSLLYFFMERLAPNYNAWDFLSDEHRRANTWWLAKADKRYVRRPTRPRGLGWFQSTHRTRSINGLDVSKKLSTIHRVLEFTYYQWLIQRKKSPSASKNALIVHGYFVKILCQNSLREEENYCMCLGWQMVIIGFVDTCNGKSNRKQKHNPKNMSETERIGWNR